MIYARILLVVALSLSSTGTAGGTQTSTISKAISGCSNDTADGSVYEDIEWERLYICFRGEQHAIGCVVKETGRIAIGGSAWDNGWVYRCEELENGTVALAKEKVPMSGTGPGLTAIGPLTASKCVQMEARLTLTVVLEMVTVSTLGVLVGAIGTALFHYRRAMRKSIDDGRSDGSERRLTGADNSALITIEDA